MSNAKFRRKFDDRVLASGEHIASILSMSASRQATRHPAVFAMLIFTGASSLASRPMATRSTRSLNGGIGGVHDQTVGNQHRDSMKRQATLNQKCLLHEQQQPAKLDRWRAQHDEDGNGESDRKELASLLPVKQWSEQGAAAPQHEVHALESRKAGEDDLAATPGAGGEVGGGLLPIDFSLQPSSKAFAASQRLLDLIDPRRGVLDFSLQTEPSPYSSHPVTPTPTPTQPQPHKPNPVPQPQPQP